MGALEAGLEGAGDARFEEAAEGPVHGVCPTLPAPVRLTDAGPVGMAGNGLTAGAALPQLPCLLTADRDD